MINTYVANGGNTATGVNPAGTKAKLAVKVGMLLSIGEPPPPGVPGCTDPVETCPVSWKLKSVIIAIPIIPTIETPAAPEA